MSSRTDLATTPLPEEEESKPLLSNKSEAIIVPSAPTNGSGGRSPGGRSVPAAPAGQPKSSLAKSNLHHRSVDNQLDGGATGEPKPHKQILFRTASHQATPLSVHYSNNGDAAAAAAIKKSDSTEHNNNAKVLF